MNFTKNLIILTAFAVSPILNAQSVAVADLQQDMDILKREVGQLRLEVEQLRRENSELIRKLSSVQNSTVGTAAVKAQVSGVRSEFDARIAAMKQEIIASVKKDMESMANQTNTAISNVVKAVEARPKTEVPATFSEDYPKTGVPYTVQSGDTLGKLARKFNSSVKWIQNANKIANPSRGLRVGDEIFIPQN